MQVYSISSGNGRVLNNISQVPLVKRHTQPLGLPLTFEGRRIKVMSYNVCNYFGPRPTKVQALTTSVVSKIKDFAAKTFDIGNGADVPVINSHRPKKRPIGIKSLAAVILAENPDVLALQEIGGIKELHDLNKQYLNNEYKHIITFPTNDNRGIRVAIMSKGNLQLVEAKTHRDEKVNGRPVFKRDFMEATFKTDTGYQFTVFTTHFKSMRGGEGVTMPSRLLEAKTAARIIQEKTKQNPNAKLLVMGDLNTRHNEWGEPILKALSGKNDTDPDNDLTEILEKDGRIPPTQRGKIETGPEKLDYCFASKGILADIQKAGVSGRFKMRPWSLASDHLPLFVNLEEPDKPNTHKKVQFGSVYHAPTPVPGGKFRLQA